MSKNKDKKKGKKSKEKLLDVSIQGVENGYVLYANTSKKNTHKVFVDPADVVAEVEALLFQ
jgi:hypothetical protein